MNTTTSRPAPVETVANSVLRPQQVGLSLLLSEMMALTALLPGMPPSAARSEAEIEADFDNMPV